MAIFITRNSATSTAAVNAAANLVVLGSNTAAGNFVAPSGTNAVIGVITAFSTDATTVGADVGGISVNLVTSGTQWFLAGASGGQNATGENSNCLPGDMVPTNLPIGPGESFSASGFSQVTDQGAQAYSLTLLFGNGSGGRTWHDIRVGGPTALNTPLALQIRGPDTALGGIAVLSQMTKLYAVTVTGASTSGVVGQAVGTILLDGGSALEGGSQSLTAMCAGGTLNTSSAMIVATKTYLTDSKVSGPGNILCQGSIGAVDVGALSLGIGLHFRS